MEWLLGEDWQAWCAYIVAAIILVIGLGYGLWKGNG